MSFENWSEDVRLLGAWIASRSPALPLILHGLEVGAILRGRSFHEGMGDALLLWSPPPSANKALRSSLLHWAGWGNSTSLPKIEEPPGSTFGSWNKDRRLKCRGTIGQGRLWHDSFDFELPAAMESEATSCAAYGSL